MENENITEIYNGTETLSNDDTGNGTTTLSAGLDTSVNDDSGANSGISSGDSGQSAEWVNGLDVSTSDISSGEVGSVSTSNMVETQMDYTPQLETIQETLSGIHGTLIIIMFMIIFAWCENKIRNAVRSFSGIGLK